jgi:hypothetical protein
LIEGVAVNQENRAAVTFVPVVKLDTVIARVRQGSSEDQV